MHQMFIGHRQQRDIIPGRYKLFLPRQVQVPTALPASHIESLQPIPRLGKIRGFDRPLAARTAACDTLMLQGSDKLLVAPLFFGC